jgi:hypothetical protein
LEKLPSTVDIPTDTAASIDWPMIAPRASAPPPVNSSSALTPCFLKMPGPIADLGDGGVPCAALRHGDLQRVLRRCRRVPGDQECSGGGEHERNGLDDNHGNPLA